MCGGWGKVRDSLDRKAETKASNDVVAVDDNTGEEMFARAGVAAE